MKKLVVLLLASLIATSAFAVIDPDPDMIGIYFDTNAEEIEDSYTIMFEVSFHGRGRVRAQVKRWNRRNNVHAGLRELQQISEQNL